MITKLNRYVNALKSKLGVKRKYNLGKVFIDLDNTHKLPEYQANNPFYDRFLPHMISYLSPGSLVVDVGANVGDTLGGMIGSNSKLKYLCVEADTNFYSELVSNVDLIKLQVPEAVIHTANVFVGKDVDDVSLEGKGGTKHAVVGGTIKSQPLDQVLKSAGLCDHLALLKTDVDGFDFDVIRSSYKLLDNCPFIFFEAQCDNTDQLRGYKELFDELSIKGYHHFALFDNFGQYVITVNDALQFSELLDYVYRQNEKKSTRTVFYFDVLAHAEEQSSIVKTALAEYS